MHGTYLRLHITIHNGWRAVVRAAACKVALYARRDAKQRAVRHLFYREMLAYHRRAQEVVWTWRL